MNPQMLIETEKRNRSVRRTVLRCLLAFAVPAGLLTAAFAVMGFAPFGNKSVLIIDMSMQYIEFFNGLKQGDIFFSWAKSLGTSYIGLFAYYVSSPLSALTLLFPNVEMPVALLYLTVLKIGLCGLTCNLYLTKRFSSQRMGSVLFSTAYALMNFNIAYSMDIMWLDGVIWMPVVLIGAEQILDREKWGLFCAALCICAISNYYITYMVVLFSILYFIDRCAEEAVWGREFCRRTLCFIKGGLCAAGIGAFLLLPTLLSQFDGKLSSVRPEGDYKAALTFSLPAFFRKLLTGEFDTLDNKAAPFIYCGLLILLFDIVFFFSKKYSKKSKLCHGALLLALFFSMWFSALDKVWHVFSYPHWLPYRYSFAFSFVMIYTAYRAYSDLKICRKNSVALLLTLVMCCDLPLHTIDTLMSLNNKYGYGRYSQYVEAMQQKETLLAKTDDTTPFYRIVSDVDRSLDDAIGFGYKGVTSSSSSYYYSVNDWLAKMGMVQRNVWSSCYGSTMITDLFFDAKYVITQYDTGVGYKLLAKDRKACLYENPYCSSPAFFIQRGSDDFKFAADPFENQNELFYRLCGERPLFRLSATKRRDDAGITITTVSKGGVLYAYFPNLRELDSTDMYVNGKFCRQLYQERSDCVLCLGNFLPGQAVTLRLHGPETAGYELYQLDDSAFTRGADKLRQNALQVREVGKNGFLSGEITCADSGTIVTSIPESSGWTVRVDGVKTDHEAFMQTFVSFPVAAGRHNITLRYTPPGLVPGTVLSIATVFLMLLFELVLRRKGKSGREPLTLPSE